MQNLFDKDEFPDDESTVSSSSTLLFDGEDSPKPFLVNFSSKRLLGEKRNEEVVAAEHEETFPNKIERSSSTISENKLDEVKALSSHRQTASANPQELLSTNDIQENTSGIEELQAENPAEEIDPEKGREEVKDEKQMDDPLEVVRSYININPSHRNMDGSIFRTRKKKIPDEARVQAMRLMNILINRREQNKERFPRNFYVTSKYTVWNFLFINLFEQFSRIANFVFLLVVLVQLVPGVSPFNIWSTILPLVFILCVSAIKEGYEDYCRHQTDNITNSIEYDCVQPDGMIVIKIIFIFIFTIMFIMCLMNGMTI